MIRATDLAHMLLRQTMKEDDWAVDATVGNGHDTLFLCEQVGPAGRVFGFDVQEAALANAGERLSGQPQVTLYHAGHEAMAANLPEIAKDRLAAVMFNLGYLPGSDKEIVTAAETTIEGLKQSLDYLKVGGLITLVLYTGHDGGAAEAEAVRAFAQDLSSNFAATWQERINAQDPAPALLAIERLK